MRRLLRRTAEKAARKTAWEVFKILLKRLGLPPLFWPALWAGRKLLKLAMWIGRRVARHRARERAAE